MREPAVGELFGRPAVVEPDGNPLAHVHMSQWMYLQPDWRTMINRDVLIKGGVVVAHITKTVAGETQMEMHLIRTGLDNPLCWSPASGEADAAGLRGNDAGGAEENYAG